MYLVTENILLIKLELFWDNYLQDNVNLRQLIYFTQIGNIDCEIS